MKTLPARPTDRFRRALGPTLLAALLLVGFGVSAQNKTRPERFSLKVSGAWGGWQAQLSSFQSASTVLQGGFGGLEFNKTLFLGWGLRKLQGDLAYVLPNDGELPVDLRYHGPIFSYTPYARNVLHPRVGLRAGFGTVSARGLPEDGVFLIEPSVGGELNVLRWARLGVEVGYRQALGADGPLINKAYLSGVYGEASLRFGFSWGSRNEGRR